MRAFVQVPLPSTFMERIRDPLVSAWPGNAKAVRAMAPRVYHFASAILETTGKRVFVDTDKQPIRIRLLRGLSELDLRVIHLVRDVRGSVASFIDKPYRGVWPKWTVRSLDVAEGAIWWRFVNMNCDRALRGLPAERWLRLHYEELSSDPQGTLDRISDFVGVERAAMPLNFYDPPHHILGNPMRLNRSSKAGIVRQDDSWKSSLQDRDLEIIARIAGRTSHYFGYTWPPGTHQSGGSLRGRSWEI